jgi:hypothetical protein
VGGIVAAAAVSTASYTVIFLVALVLYRRAAKLQWRALVPSWFDIKDGAGLALRGVRRAETSQVLARRWRA